MPDVAETEGKERWEKKAIVFCTFNKKSSVECSTIYRKISHSLSHPMPMIAPETDKAGVFLAQKILGSFDILSLVIVGLTFLWYLYFCSLVPSLIH